MARFNTKVKTAPDTTNYEGSEAYSESPRLELVSNMLTNFTGSQFYKSKEQSVDDISKLIENMVNGGDGLFVGKAAVFARTKYGMRSISHVAAAEIAHNVKGLEWTKRFIDKVIYRPDDATEILAYYLGKYGKPVPNSIKKGLGSALTRFDEYQIAKYKGGNRSVSLIDVVNLCRPVPSVAIDKLMNGKLSTPDTWETAQTKAGQSAETEEDKVKAKSEEWARQVNEKKLGYFALLRNLRNIYTQAPEVVTEACKQLTDRKAIKKSLVMPFRFLTALDTLEDAPREVVKAISDALEISLDNVPTLEGKTLIALDDSGSMSWGGFGSVTSNLSPLKIGAVFAAVLAKTNDADLLLFSDTARYQPTVNPNDSVSTIAQRIIEDSRAAGTNFHTIFSTANKHYDRVIILSDMQAWMDSTYDGYYCTGTPNDAFKLYKKKFSADPHLYSFDLNGYGTLQFPEKKVYALAGFSDKVFDIMELLESDREAMIHEIEKVEI